MRVKQGATVEDTVAAMSGAQKRALARVEKSRAAESTVLLSTRQHVREALQTGVPARVLADRLGVTLARVYQMRDEAENIESAGEEE